MIAGVCARWMGTSFMSGMRRRLRSPWRGLRVLLVGVLVAGCAVGGPQRGTVAVEGAQTGSTATLLQAPGIEARLTSGGLELAGDHPASTAWRVGVHGWSACAESRRLYRHEARFRHGRLGYAMVEAGETSSPIEEWYVLGDRVVEHGITVDAPPVCGAAGEIAFEIRAEPGLSFRPHGDGLDFLLVDETGTAHFEYAGMHAFDALGREIPLRVDAASRALHVHVALDEVHFPLVIDPLIRRVVAVETAVGQGIVRFPAVDAPQLLALSADDVLIGSASAGQGLTHVAMGASALKSTSAPRLSGLRKRQAVAAMLRQSDWLFVGAPAAVDGDAGTVLVFRFQAGAWVPSQRLDGGHAGSPAFGGVLAAAGDGWLAVAAPGARGRSGQVFVYRFDGDSWIEATRLASPQGKRNDAFGAALAFHRGQLLVGAPDDSRGAPQAGAVHAFVESGEAWWFGNTLHAQEPTVRARFGASLAATGDWLVVGAPGEAQQAPSAGAVHVYRAEDGFPLWAGLLSAPTISPYAGFGTRLALAGSQLAILTAGGVDGLYLADLEAFEQGTTTVIETVDLGGRRPRAVDWADARTLLVLAENAAGKAEVVVLDVDDLIFADGFEAREGDSVPPTIAFDAPLEGAHVASPRPQLRLSYADDDSGVLPSTLRIRQGTRVLATDCSATASSAVCDLDEDLDEGLVELSAQIADLAGNLSLPATRWFFIDITPPAAVVTGLLTVGPVVDGQVQLSGGAGAAEPGSWLLVENLRTGQRWLVQVAADGSFVIEVEAEPGDTFDLWLRDQAGNEGASVEVAVGLPPNPIEIMPEEDDDGGFPGDFIGIVAPIFEADPPIQIGLEPGVLEPTRAAVVRGRVLRRGGDPLPGVRVSIKGYSEYGHTFSREDGEYDLVINGGGLLILDYAKPGYLPAQRSAQVAWNDFTVVEDLVLVRLDSTVSVIDLGAGQGQMAVGSVVADKDGVRAATVYFPPGAGASMLRADGTRQTLQQLDVRFTEYTVGEDGPQAMPAPLPATSGYTYAVEISVDQVLEEGSKIAGVDVLLEQPVAFYNDNFLGFPAGERVPTGYYDADASAWVAVEDGLVIDVLAIEDGLAVLDVDGSGQAADAAQLEALGIDTEERLAMAQRFQAGDSFWRVRITHFSTWDCNWPYGPPWDAVYPEPEGEEIQGNPPEPDCKPGCDIFVQSQTMRETVDVADVPGGLLSFHSGQIALPEGPSLNIKLTPAELPSLLRYVVLELTYLGRRQRIVYPPIPNHTARIPAVALDPYYRTREGKHPVHVRVGFAYQGVYRSAGGGGGSGRSFGRSGGLPITGDRDRIEVTLWGEWRGRIGFASAQRTRRTAAWMFPWHHAFDPVGGVVYLGNGQQFDLREQPWRIETMAGDAIPGFEGDGGPASEAQLHAPEGLVHDASGRLYIADRLNHRVRRIGTDGVIVTVAGGDLPGDSGDGGPGTQALLREPAGLALGPDGSLYIADRGNHRVRVLRPDGSLHALAGSGTAGGDGDDGPALAARLNAPRALAVAADGTVYIADTGNERVRAVLPDGFIVTVAGGGSGGDGDALATRLRNPVGLALNRQGWLYIAEADAHRVRRLTPDGVIVSVAGTGTAAFNGDFQHGTQTNLSPAGLALDGAGRLLIADGANHRIRRLEPDGSVITVAGNGGNGYAGDGGTAKSAMLGGPRAVSESPSGAWAVSHSHAVRRVFQRLPTATGGEIVVPSRDGEILHVFNARGVHQRALDALTGAEIYRLEYDEHDLVAMQDAFGNRTLIERDAQRNPQAIVGPYGGRTELELDSHGRLRALVDAENGRHEFDYDPRGLLTFMRNPRGHEWHYQYDDFGRLVRDDMPDGGGWIIESRDFGQRSEVDFTTRLGRTETFRRELHGDGSEQRSRRSPDGTETHTWLGAAGEREDVHADGTQTASRAAPDPRFGAVVMRPAEFSLSVPEGPAIHVIETLDIEPPGAIAPGEIERFIETSMVNGRAYRSEFEPQLGRVTVQSPTGRSALLQVDSLRRPLRVEVPGIAPVEYVYDDRGRLERVRQTGDGQVREYLLGYDTGGHLASITDPLSRTVSLVNDGVGRPRQIGLPGGRGIALDYDENGNVVELETPHGETHTFGYDPLDREAAYLAPDVEDVDGLLETEYDLDGALKEQRFPGGAVVRYGYDAHGRLTSIERGAQAGDDDSEVAVGYAWQGFLPLAQSFSGRVQGVVQYGFDANLWLRELTVEGLRTDYDYDDDGLLIEAAVPGAALALARDPDNGLLTGTAVGSVADAWSYNAFAEPDAYQAEVDGAVAYATSFERDPLGRITGKTETVGGLTTTYAYGYDEAGRLHTVHTNGVETARYEYDLNGNRTLAEVAAWGTRPALTRTGDFDAQDRLLDDGHCQYRYRDSGELSERQCGAERLRTHYDVHGNLTAAELPDGRQIEYLIDGEGRRVGKRVDGLQVQGFLYMDQLNPVAELDGLGHVVASFIYAERGHVPSLMLKGGKTYRIVADHLGSVRLVIDIDTGAVVQRKDYDEWGVPVLDTHPGFQPFGFAGGLEDRDVGFVRFGARDFDPVVGRWTAKDGIGFAAGDTNLYAYVWNDPINYIDPSGYCPEEDGFGWTDAASLIVPGWDLGACVFRGGCDGLDWALAAWDLVPGWGKSGKVVKLGRQNRGARDPKVRDALRRGQEAHRRYDPGPTYNTRVRLPSRRRPDAVDFQNRVVRELKPNNPRAVRRGERQVERYRQELEATYGGNWRSYVDTYDP
jgi:RHS repeat-associated protein